MLGFSKICQNCGLMPFWGQLVTLRICELYMRLYRGTTNINLNYVKSQPWQSITDTLKNQAQQPLYLIVLPFFLPLFASSH